MSAAVVIALIALAGSIFSTVATVVGVPALQARRDRGAVLESYREPLLAASYELQARLHNILRNRFIEDFIDCEAPIHRASAIDSTLYVFAQFFGWREAIRREVQFLRFGTDMQTREVARLLRDIAETFLDKDYGPQFMIWRVEQRGFGERMLSTDNGKPTCLGYASFIDQRDKMDRWLAPLEHDLRHLQDDGRRRLTDLQHQLLELVERLDADHTRYPFPMQPA
jgi:hypothetical protein